MPRISPIYEITDMKRAPVRKASSSRAPKARQAGVKTGKNRPASKEKEPLIRNMPLAFARMKVIRDARGKVRDARIIHANPAFCAFLESPDVSPAGRLISELFPAALKASPIPWLKLFGKSLKESASIRYRGFAATTGRWLDVTFYRIGHDEFVVLAADITDQQAAEAALRESEARHRRFIETSHEGICALDKDSRITYINPKAAEIIGVPAKKLIGRLPGDFVFSEDQADHANMLKARKAGAVSRYERRIRRMDGKERWVIVSSVPIIDLDGSVAGAFVMLTDITAQKRVEAALRDSEELYRTLFEMESDAIILIDAETFRIVEVNQAAVDLYGFDREELLAMCAPDLSAEPEETKAAIRAGGNIVRIALRFHRKNNRDVFPVEINSRFFERKDRKFLLVAVRDVSERFKAEEALKSAGDNIRRSENLLNSIIEQSPHAMWISDSEGTLIRINPACCRLFSLAADEVLGKYNVFKDNIVRDQGAMPAVERVFRNGETVTFPLEYDSSDLMGIDLHRAVKRHLDVTIFPIKDRDGRVTNAVTQHVDITEQTRLGNALRESEARHRLLFERAGIGIGYFDKEGRVILMNQASLGFLGGRLEDYLGKPVTDIYPGELGKVYLGRIQKAFGERVTAAYEDRVDISGWVCWVHSTYSGISDEADSPIGVQVISQDITDRKAAEEAVRASLREKEVLLKEIHHRVKNNLQIVSSLLSHQARLVKDPEVLKLFKESQNRIKTMALVHDKLYRSQSLDRINVGEYAESLIVYLFQALQVDPQRVAWEKDIRRVDMDINTAIPLGLIVNELVSNALKYAFPGDRTGKIRIEIVPAEDGAVRLTVRDDGVGIPAGLDIMQTETLGLQIVGMLAQQLEGAITLDRKGGTAVTVVFREPKYKPRV
jgi:PAS domain S-box-containing protein